MELNSDTGGVGYRLLDKSAETPRHKFLDFLLENKRTSQKYKRYCGKSRDTNGYMLCLPFRKNY